MTKQELKAKIDKLENGIKSKATPSNLIAPLKAQKTKLEKELQDMEASEKKAVKTKKVSKVAEKIKAAKTSVAKKTPAKAPAKEERKKDNIARDGDRKSLPAGKRISKTGKVYYETRVNRSDKQTSRKPYLADGGKLKDQYYEITNYSFNKYNTYILSNKQAEKVFGKERFEKSVDANAWKNDLVSYPIEILGQQNRAVSINLTKESAEIKKSEWESSHKKEYYPLFSAKVEEMTYEDYKKSAFPDPNWKRLYKLVIVSPTYEQTKNNEKGAYLTDGGELTEKKLLVLKADDEKGGNVFVSEEVVKVKDLDDAKSKVKEFVSKYNLDDKTFTGGRYFKLVKNSKKTGNVTSSDVKSVDLGTIDYKGNFKSSGYKMADGGSINFGEDLGGGFSIGNDVYITDSKSLFQGKTGFVSGSVGRDLLVTILDNGNERSVVVSKKGVEKLDAPMEHGGYVIFEGRDNYNDKPLYKVISKDEDNDYDGEFHDNREDAEKELNELKNKNMNYAKGGITREGNHLMHFEPYFEKEVEVASIDEDSKTIRPSHGYFHPNKIGKKSIAWAKKNGYKFIQDGKEFEDGGYMADGGEVPAHFGSGKNIDVFGYQTQHFDICGAAVKEFEAAVEIMQNAKESEKESLARCAKYVDGLFGIEKLVVENSSADDANFYEAVSDIMSASIYNYRAEMSINLFSFVPQHLKEIAVRMAKAEKGGFYALGGMTAGRWYRDKSGEEFKFIGKIDSGANKGKFLFTDGQKSVYKDLEDFEGGRPKETKLFGFFEHGGEVGKSFSIKDMREKLDRMFPDSFKFNVTNFSKEGNAALNSSALLQDMNTKYGGLEDKEINSKLFFPQYKRDHDIKFRIAQGGENTYFYFVLEAENGEQYIGNFGFKDRGDVSSDYITRFIALLMEQYGLPFEVKHSVMEKGGYMEHGGSVAEGNYEMLMSNIKAIKHHAEELQNVAKPNTEIEAWVLSKSERAETDLSDITHYLDGLKMAKGGYMAKGGEIAFDNSNLYLNGFGIDSNGNSVVKVSFPNQRAFSIQTNGVLKETNNLYTKNIKELTEAQIKTIEKEVVDYVKQFGSKEQKQRLKTYSGYMAKGGMTRKGGQPFEVEGRKFFYHKDDGNVYDSNHRLYAGSYSSLELAKKSLEKNFENIKTGNFYKDGGYMASGAVIPKGARVNMKIKDWYIKNYPTDELGEEINDTMTFKGFWALTGQGNNPYEVLGVHDSVVRERVEEKLSQILGKKEMAKGGIYSSDSLYILKVSKDGKEVGEERFRAKNIREAKEMGEDYEEKYKTKFGGDLSFSVKEAMADGGKVKFADKVKSVQESLLKRKKVAPQVQKDYGKTYSKAEAKESAQRIVGSRMAQLKEKMAKKKK